MEIIKQRERVEVESYMLCFENADGIGGYSFECNKSGEVHKLDNPAAVENHRRCLAGEDGIKPTGIQDYSYHYTSPKIGKCSCGREVQLDHFTNTCDCGLDYNSSGTLLAPRSQWGEETGESLADILRIP